MSTQAERAKAIDLADEFINRNAPGLIKELGEFDTQMRRLESVLDEHHNLFMLERVRRFLSCSYQLNGSLAALMHEMDERRETLS